MATFLERLKAAMLITHALESGETPITDEQTDGLAIANQMLEAFTIDRLMIYSIQRTTHTLVVSTNPHRDWREHQHGSPGKDRERWPDYIGAGCGISDYCCFFRG